MSVLKSNFEVPGANDEMFQAVSELVIPKLGEINQHSNQVEALGVGCSAIFAALTGVAYIVGQFKGLDRDSPDEMHMKAVSPASILVAALVAVKGSNIQRLHDSNGENVSLELNPIIYLAAIKAAETILGRNVDAELNPGLVEAARHWERDHGYSGTWEEQTAENRLHGGQHHLH